MKIAIGADHAGYELKEQVVRQLRAQGHDVADHGTASDESVDYPEFAMRVAEDVTKQKADRGILVCGSGIGMCMAANRISGVRAAVLRVPFDAKMSREHNDANIACIGARVTPPDEVAALLQTWLATPFAGGRHERRTKKIDTLSEAT